MVDFSAKQPALGYMYQAQYALWLLLSGPEERELVLETLDDIVLEKEGTARDLLQLKHHGTASSLTNSSPELWKTLRIWSTHLKDSSVAVPPTVLTLITTATAPAGSIASNLRHGQNRKSTAALDELRKIANKSENETLQTAFEVFKALSDDQQKRLVDAIFILDNSPDISGTGKLIRNEIRFAVDRQNREGLFERLEGWWLGKVVDQLNTKKPMPIAGFEVHDKLRAIAEQFGPDALPIDYLDAKPDDLNPNIDDRMFVRQLRAIDVKLGRIEKAMLDYYRAFEQRSRWAREELLVGDEVERYERRLIDEWQRFAAVVTEDLNDTAADLELKKAGREIFNWMELKANIRIRDNVTEPYVMRGSFHLLADKSTPAVWWHPKFMERLGQILGAEASAAS